MACFVSGGFDGLILPRGTDCNFGVGFGLAPNGSIGVLLNHHVVTENAGQTKHLLSGCLLSK